MPAANDNWANAELITGGSGSLTADNTGATSETGEPIPSDGPGDGPWQSLWYRWVAPDAAPRIFSTQGSRHAGGTVGLDTVLAVYTGSSLAGLTEVVADDDYLPFTGLDNLNSRVQFTPASGTTYYIQVSGYDSTEFGDVHLAWSGLPLFTTPTIVAPTAAQHFDIGDDLALLIDWNTLTGQTHYEARIVSGVAVFASSGDVASSASSHTLTMPYGTDGSFTAEVRAHDASDDWSDWATVAFTVTSLVDTPLDCVEDELLADSPDTLWIPRETTGVVTEDLSGNGHHGHVAHPTMRGSTVSHAGTFVADGGTLNATAPTGAAVGDTIVFGIVDHVVFSSGGGYLSLGLPSGFSLVAQVDAGDNASSLAVVVGIHDGSASYAFTINVTAGTPTTHSITYAGAHYEHAGTIYDVDTASTASGTTLARPTNTIDTTRGGQVVIIGATTGSDAVSPGLRASDISSSSAISLGDYEPIFGAAGFANWAQGGAFPQPMMAVSLVLPYDDDPIYAEWGADSNICDDDCATANFALGMGTPDDVNHTSVTPLGPDIFNGATEWTFEVDFYVDPGAAFPGGGTFAWAAVSGQVTIYVEGNDDSTIDVRVGAGGYGATFPSKRGCWNHVIVVFDNAAINKLQVWLNGRRVGTGGASPITSVDSFLVLSEGTSAPFPLAALGLLATYTTALSATRVVAHAAHFCQLCRIGGGWKVGRAGFPSG